MLTQLQANTMRLLAGMIAGACMLLPAAATGIGVTPDSPSLTRHATIAQASADPSWAENTVTLLTITAQQNGHTRPVRSVVFSPDGNFLITGSADRTVKIWNLRAQSLERTITEGEQVNAIAISPNGQLIATARLDGGVSLWNKATGQLIARLPRHNDVAKTVAFSPDGRVLASGSGDKTIKLWNVETRTLIREIATQQWIESLAFSADGATLASAGVGRQVHLWDWTTGRLIRSLGPYANPIYAVAFSPNSEWLAFSPNSSSVSQGSQRGDSNTIQITNRQGRSVGRSLRGHQDSITSLAFSPSGQTLISGSWDQTIKIWDVQTGELVRSFTENERRILSVTFSPDGRSFAIGSGDGTIKVFVSTEPTIHRQPF